MTIPEDDRKIWIWAAVIALVFFGAIAGNKAEPEAPKYPECEQIARDFDTTPENCAAAVDAAVAEVNG